MLGLHMCMSGTVLWVVEEVGVSSFLAAVDPVLLFGLQRTRNEHL